MINITIFVSLYYSVKKPFTDQNTRLHSYYIFWGIITLLLFIDLNIGDFYSDDATANLTARTEISLILGSSVSRVPE